MPEDHFGVPDKNFRGLLPAAEKRPLKRHGMMALTRGGKSYSQRKHVIHAKNHKMKKMHFFCKKT